MRGDVRELAREVDPHLELVRAPVRGQSGIERVGQDHRISCGLGVLDGSDSERYGARVLPRVGPATGQRGAEQRPVQIGVAGVVRLEEYGGNPAGLGAEHIGTGEVERRLRPRVDLTDVHGRHRGIRAGAASLLPRAVQQPLRPSRRCSRR